TGAVGGAGGQRGEHVGVGAAQLDADEVGAGQQVVVDPEGERVAGVGGLVVDDRGEAEVGDRAEVGGELGLGVLVVEGRHGDQGGDAGPGERLCTNDSVHCRDPGGGG